VAAPVLAAHTGLELPRVRAALNVLADVHLLLARQDGRYRMSTLVRLVAAGLEPDAGDLGQLPAACTGSPADGVLGRQRQTSRPSAARQSLRQKWVLRPTAEATRRRSSPS
jgi:DNA-binding transcriptional ArsR family regulator